MSTRSSVLGSSNCYPPAVHTTGMAGGGSGKPWSRLQCRPGMLLEGAVLDDGSAAHGTVIVEVTDPLSADAQGQWVIGSYVLASDPQMRDWMQTGAGQKLVRRCAYHLCAGASLECGAVRRGASIHLGGPVSSPRKRLMGRSRDGLSQRTA